MRLFAVWLILIFPQFAAADEPASGKGIRIAYFEFPPFSYTDDDGQGVGFSIALLRRLLEGQGYRVQPIASENPGEVFDLVRSGQAEVAVLLSRTEGRSRDMLASDTIGAFTAKLFSRAGDKSRLADYSGHRISAIERSLGASLVGEIAEAQVVLHETADAQFLALLEGSVDAMIADEDSMFARLRGLGLDPLVRALDPPLSVLPYVFYVNRGHPDIHQAINEGYARLPAQEFQALREQYLGTPTRFHSDQLHNWTMAAAAILGLAALAVGLKLRRMSFSAKRLQEETAGMKLLIDALDGIDAAIVIYDEEFRAIHWNAGFHRNFPGMQDLLQERATMFDLIRTSRFNGLIEAQADQMDTEALLQALKEKLRRGETVNRVVHGANGLTYEAAEFPVGTSRYASVRIDVTKLYRQREIIERQNASLEDANRQLAMFATVAAHDLKAPLNQQSALMEAIREDLEDDAIHLPTQVEDYFTDLANISTRMKRLIDDLLEYARSEASEEKAQTFGPNGRMANIISMAGLPSSFEVDVQPDLPHVTLPPTEFDTVLRNLVSNAYKHHDGTEGLVKIRGHCDETTIYLEIEDDGPGIPVEYREHIFEPFKRLSAGSEGSGLGLSFIRKTIETWGGTVWVTEARTKGSVFHIRLPRGQAGYAEDVQPRSAAG